MTQTENTGDALYRRIQSAMRDRITRGEWAIGAALPSRRVLCAEFQTTRVTLDKAIHGLVSEGLLGAAVGSGTFVMGRAPVKTAASLLSAYHVGVISGRGALPDGGEAAIDENHYFGPLFQGIRDGFTGQAVDVIYDHLPSRDYLRFAQERALDGLVIVTTTLDSLPSLRALTEAGLPYVAIGASFDSPRDADLCTVDPDNRQGTQDAVEHLLSLGHQQVALVNLALAHANHHARLEGYFHALASAGLSVNPDDLVLMPKYDTPCFEERVDSWLTRALMSGALPTAILACDYAMALATLQSLRRHRLRVPEDISLVAFDDPVSAGHLTPPLTTVRLPVYRLGRRAAARLLSALEAGTTPRGSELLPTQLIVRESTCPPRQAS